MSTDKPQGVGWFDESTGQWTHKQPVHPSFLQKTAARDRKPEISAKRKIRTKAQTRALLELSHRYADEYKEIYDRHKAELVAEYENEYGPVPDLRTSPYRTRTK